MNWLAIGILSLLALSMMISSKHFRVIMGSVAVVAVTAVAVISFLGMRAIPSAGDLAAHTRPFFSWRFEITKPNLRETAVALLADMDRAITEPSDNTVTESAGGDGSLDDVTMPPTKPIGSDGTSRIPDASNISTFNVQHIELKPPIGNVPQEVTLQVKMANVIREYLKTCHNSSSDPGVAELQPENLDWRLLKYLDKGTDTNGVKHVTLVFDDKFHDHVRDRGLHMVTKDHLMKAGFASGGTLAVLTTLFGLLKLKQAKREIAPARDLLASSGVWMV